MADLDGALAWMARHVPDPVTGSRTWRLLRARDDVAVAGAGLCVAKVAFTPAAGHRLRVGLEGALAAHRAGLRALAPLHDQPLTAPFGTLTLWPRVLPGAPDGPPTTGDLAALGDLVSRIAVTSARTPAPVPRLDLGPVVAALPRDPSTEPLRALAVRFCERRPGPGGGGTWYGRAHGDLHLGNVLRSSSGVWVIDWDWSGFWPAGWDAATVYASLALDPATAGDAEPLWEAFAGRYTGPDPDPDLVAARMLVLAAIDWARRRPVEQQRVLEVLTAAVTGVLRPARTG